MPRQMPSRRTWVEVGGKEGGHSGGLGGGKKDQREAMYTAWGV